MHASTDQYVIIIHSDLYGSSLWLMLDFDFYLHINSVTRIEVGRLPEPDMYHHIVEDFLTNW